MNETKLIAEKNKIMDDLASQRAILERLRSDNKIVRARTVVGKTYDSISN